jgi:hypothetical protein
MARFLKTNFTLFKRFILDHRAHNKGYCSRIWRLLYGVVVIENGSATLYHVNGDRLSMWKVMLDPISSYVSTVDGDGLHAYVFNDKYVEHAGRGGDGGGGDGGDDAGSDGGDGSCGDASNGTDDDDANNDANNYAKYNANNDANNDAESGETSHGPPPALEEHKDTVGDTVKDTVEDTAEDTMEDTVVTQILSIKEQIKINEEKIEVSWQVS